MWQALVTLLPHSLLIIFKNYCQNKEWKIYYRRYSRTVVERKEIMSSLTPRKMKEIDNQLRQMREKRDRRVFLTVFCNIRRLEDTLALPQMIMDSIRKINGVESVSYTNGTNVITVIAQWEDYEASYYVKRIQKIHNVRKVTVDVLSPLF